MPEGKHYGGLGRRCVEEYEWVLVGAYPAVLGLGFELAKPGYISS